MGKAEKNNTVRMSEFSRLCGVTRGAISQCVAKNKIILTADKKIDLDNPVNKSFLRCHSHGATTATKTTKTENKKSAIKPDDKKTATKKTTQNKQSKPTAKTVPDSEDGDDSDSPEKTDGVNAEALRALDDAIKRGDKEAEEKQKIVIDRAYYESLKIKNDAELKAISIDQKNGTLAEREIIEGLVLELNKTIQEQFFNCVVKQSVEICARLGKVGFEQDVQDVLATDNSRRIHEVKRVTARFLWDRYIKPVSGGENPYIRDLSSDDGEAEE